jgi:hypothetical protein
MEAELLKAVDRGGRGYVFSPTHEEAVTSLVAGLQSISHKYLFYFFPCFTRQFVELNLFFLDQKLKPRREKYIFWGDLNLKCNECSVFYGFK